MARLNNPVQSVVDSKGLPTFTASTDSYFHTWCLYVRASISTFQNLAKQNKVQVRTVIATGGTVGLAEGIIDDTHLMYIIHPPTRYISYWIA